MCVVSMITEHYTDKWERLRQWTIGQPPPITQAELDEFRELLQRAREYDRKMNQPDCELDGKRKRLKKIAKQLGVEISFV